MGAVPPRMGAVRLDQPAAILEWNLGANRLFCAEHLGILQGDDGVDYS